MSTTPEAPGKPGLVKVEGLYAFWSYDQYPFLLGGHVTRIGSEGRVETKEFGQGNWFKPLLLVPEGEGEGYRKKLKELEAGHDAALQALRKEWLARAHEAIPFLPRKP